MRDRVWKVTGQLAGLFALLWVLLVFAAVHAVASDDLPASNRIRINLGQTPWRYVKDVDDPGSMQPGFDDSGWQSVGVPQTPSDNDTFINTKSGGDQLYLTGNINWYRKHFTVDPSYANRKIFVEFEGAHTGAQVYINGQFIPGNSLINPKATHVIGFVPFIVDITPYVKFDGTDNVMAVKVARGDSFFESPSFSGAFRFGQDDTGLFRPVWMYITDKVHIPENVYAVLGTWGTYVSTVAASTASATIRVQTNVLNEYPTDQQVTLTTQIVNASGNVVATAQDTSTVPANVPPGLHPGLFDQVLTVANPTLWFPNNSVFGSPYLYHVIHLVSVGGTVVDSTETPLGIRTITWDQNFPIINGHPHYLWGASGRYDYPALGSAVPEELQWRDLNLLAQAGGSLYRPGHSSQGPEFLDAADAYGVMMIQPSGDGENGFSILCTSTVTTGCTTADNVELKKELHRDMIVHDRNHPSVLAWEADNGSTDTSLAQSLKALSQVWDPILTRAQADRMPNPLNGDILGCSGEGCDINVKQTYPDSPAWGSEYWGDGVGRALYDYELAFAAPYLNDWVHSVAGKSFGIAHWYLADTPGEINQQIDGPGSPQGNANGTTPEMVRGNGASMMDANRIPRLLYYIYEAAWTPFQIKPVVKLAYHWNRSAAGPVTVNAFSNCATVRLLLNGQPVGPDQTPNPPTSDPRADLSENTTLLPAQVHWNNVAWAPGTLLAECLDGNGQVAATDTQVTAGPADHIVLTVEPELVKPDGEVFALTANGTDAALVTATVVDANNVRVPDASPIITFNVSGPGTYRGGSDHLVTANQPLGYHAPGDPNLSAEGGLTRIAVKTQFMPGTVTVTASAPGLGGGTTTFNVLPTGSQQVFNGDALVIGPQQASSLQIITQPLSQTAAVGQTAQFTVLTAGASPNFQWMKNGVPIAGATSFTYTTPAVLSGDNGASFSVDVSNASGSITSSAAILTVVAPAVPTIVTPPAPQSITSGQGAEFTVAAAGSPVLTYQWLKNGAAIPGATQAVYDTPIMQTSDSGTVYSVVVTNSAGTVTSGSATLTVGAATLPSILSQPRSQSVPVGQSVTFNVLASGSAPLQYTWTRDGTPVGTNASSIVIASTQNGDAGSYVVTVTNSAGSVTSTPATLAVSGGGDTNLALGAKATASSEQNAGLSASLAVDGSFTSRWSSAPGIDPSWIELDLGSVQTFDEVALAWENAFARAYQIQVSNDNQNWTTVFTQNAGVGGTETISFPSTSARYVRMYGTQRATDYGYSLFEFEVFDAPQCGSAAERYTPLGAAPGQYTSTIPGLPSGPNVPTVRDNLSGLVWQQFQTTFPAQGAQFTQTIAAQYCASVGMRLPTQNEALTVARSNYGACAFPAPWGTWTTTGVPNDPTNAYLVFSSGQSVPGIINNTPGWALCVAGTSAAAPVIAAQPGSQSVAQGQTAQFTVGVTGTGPFSFNWLKNGTPVAITTTPVYTTPATVAADSGAVFTVVIANGGGSVTSAPATLTVTAAIDTGTGTGDGGNPVTGGNPGDGGNPGAGAPAAGNPVPSANLAIGHVATSSGVEGDAFLPAAAVDGNDATRWSSSFVDPSWIQVDLGSAQTFDRVVLRWQDSYAVAYQIQVSNDEGDNKNWTTVYSQATGKGGTEDLRFTATTARYVRMFGTQRATQFGYSLFEFGVYNTATTPQYAVTASASGNGAITPAGTTQVFQGGPQTYSFTPAAGFAVTGVQVDGSSIGLVNSYTFDDVLAPHTISVTFGPSSAAANLALGAKASASGLEADAYPASAAVDGNLATRWSSAFVDPSWIQLDLGSVQTFNRVILFWQDAFGVAYQIQTSNDGQNWTPVFTQTAGKGGTEDLSFPTVSARYVRMFGTQRNTAYGYSLWEFQVYNMPVAPAITAQPAAVTVNQGDPAQFAVVASGTAPLSYQWLKNGTPVATTTTPSYTTPPTVAGDSGATFSVIVSNAAGSVTSTGVTLSVNAPPGSANDGTGQDTGGGTAGTAGANLALGKVATTSGVQGDGYNAANAVDGNLGSRWSSDFNDNAWLTVDLGQPMRFDRVVLRWENAYGKSYLIQASNDNQTWTTVSTRDAGAGGTEDLPVVATTARYVRMQGVQRATQYGYSLFEFEIYNSAATPAVTIAASSGPNGAISPSGSVSVGEAGTQTFTAVPAAGFAVGALTVDGQSQGVQSTYTFTNATAPHSISVSFVPLAAGTNLALHKTATASGLEADAYPASAAVDGDAATRWSSAFVDPSWISVDLGTRQTFDRVVLNWENAHAVAYQIQTSDDNQNWTTVLTQTAGQGGIEDLKLPAPAAGRYVRMFATQRSTPYGDSLYEFEVYNTAAGTSAAASFIEQLADQTVPAGQNGHFAVIASGSGPFSYQWRRNGTPVSGATARTYDTAATTNSDDGSVYSVVVTGPNGPITSNDARLSVDSTIPNYTVTPGFVGVDLLNNTKGAFTDDQVYVEIIGRDPQNGGRFVWLKPDGTMVPMALSDNDAPGHLSTAGQNYSNYAFTLAQAKTLQFPHVSSARMFVSLGSPLFIKVLDDANGNVAFAGPNPQNLTDPNVNVVFDWIEFDNGGDTLFINTTQVDEFGIPLVEDIYGMNHTTHMQTGTTLSSAEIFAAYAREVPPEFQSLSASKIRIMAPAKGSFGAGQANGNYFDGYVNQMWQLYANQDLVLNLFSNSRRFVGRTQGDQLVFTEVDLSNGAFVGGTYSVSKPSTQDVLLGAGTLATGDSVTLQIEAQICAALNRHVMEDVNKWAVPTAWWSQSPTNEYARFFHDHSVSGLAYGFAYDDVSNGSSSIVAQKPEHMVLGIGW
ncbi:discoidin domain-containing protein [Paraburkholderia fungorum]|uniref:discoidin domain-containing protein n=1 Tax=Paraburkholderia fungorum TaxID=134537 RepID=UPI0038BBB4EE